MGLFFLLYSLMMFSELGRETILIFLQMVLSCLFDASNCWFSCPDTAGESACGVDVNNYVMASRFFYEVEL